MFDYIRAGNPTRNSLEIAVAACEDSKYGMRWTCNIIIRDVTEIIF